MPLRSITFLLYFFGSSAAALAFPMVGVICYVLLYHVYPQSTWWGKALAPMGIRYAYVCAVCLLIGVGLNLNRLKFGRRFVHPVEWGILLVLLTMVLSAYTGHQWDFRTDFMLDKMWKVFLFTVLMTHVVVTRRRVWYLVILLTIMTLYLGHEAKNAPLSAFTNNRLDGIGGPDFRESTGLAVHLFALLPFAAILLRQKSLCLKALSFFAACYGINAILLCRARSAFLAGIVAGVLAIWYVPRRHRRWVVAVLALAVTGGAILSDTWFRDRMVTIVSSKEERDQSAASRLLIWTAAWEMLKDKPMGVGIGQFQRRIGRYVSVDQADLQHRDAHNTFILCVGELGYPGLAALLLTLGMSWGTLASVNRRAKAELSDPDLFELFVFANRLALLVYVVSGMFASRFYTEGMWMLVVLPVCLARAVENEIRVEAHEEVRLEKLLSQWTGRVHGPQVTLPLGGR